MLEDIAAEVAALGPAVTETSVRAHLDGKRDERPAVLRITSARHTDGSGAETSAEDEIHAWQLLDMYGRWAARHSATHLRSHPVRRLHTRQRGYGDAVVITAPYAYGKLRGEAGRHVFISSLPGADGRTRTSELTVEVVALAEDDDPGAPPDGDIRCDTYRDAGPSCFGPQYPTTARLVHLPTGMAVDYHRDRPSAMLVLRSFITSQPTPVDEVRCYDFRGAGAVTDLHTGRRHTHPHTVLGGDLDELIAARVLPGIPGAPADGPDGQMGRRIGR